jgi:hypothetical protein
LYEHTVLVTGNGGGDVLVIKCLFPPKERGKNTTNKKVKKWPIPLTS